MATTKPKTKQTKPTKNLYDVIKSPVVVQLLNQKYVIMSISPQYPAAYFRLKISLAKMEPLLTFLLPRHLVSAIVMQTAKLDGIYRNCSAHPSVLLV